MVCLLLLALVVFCAGFSLLLMVMVFVVCWFVGFGLVCFFYLVRRVVFLDFVLFDWFDLFGFVYLLVGGFCGLV